MKKTAHERHSGDSRRVCGSGEGGALAKMKKLLAKAVFSDRVFTLSGGWKDQKPGETAEKSGLK
jgi:hypothetical protein